MSHGQKKRNSSIIDSKDTACHTKSNSLKPFDVEKFLKNYTVYKVTVCISQTYSYDKVTSVCICSVV